MTITDRLPVRPSLTGALAMVALVGSNLIWSPAQHMLVRVWPNEFFVNGLPYLLILAGVGYATVRWGRVSRDGWDVTATRFFDGLTAAGVAAAASIPVVFIARRFAPDANETRTDIESIPLLLAVALVVIAAPVVEELVFRGWLLGALAPTRLGPAGAVAVSSVLFGAAHVVTGVYGWFGFALTTTAGVVYAVTVLLTRSIIPAVVAHAAGNLAALLTVTGHLDGGLAVMQLGLFAAGVWTAGGAITAARRLRRRDGDHEPETVEAG